MRRKTAASAGDVKPATGKKRAYDSQLDTNERPMQWQKTTSTGGELDEVLDSGDDDDNFDRHEEVSKTFLCRNSYLHFRRELKTTVRQKISSPLCVWISRPRCML
jgi:hypothetical protein